jgi:hypothetical protein
MRIPAGTVLLSLVVFVGDPECWNQDSGGSLISWPRVVGRYIGRSISRGIDGVLNIVNSRRGQH